jgi:hypothetical protein
VNVWNTLAHKHIRSSINFKYYITYTYLDIKQPLFSSNTVRDFLVALYWCDKAVLLTLSYTPRVCTDPDHFKAFYLPLA